MGVNLDAPEPAQGISQQPGQVLWVASSGMSGFTGILCVTAVVEGGQRELAGYTLSCTRAVPCKDMQRLSLDGPCPYLRPWLECCAGWRRLNCILTKRIVALLQNIPADSIQVVAY